MKFRLFLASFIICFIFVTYYYLTLPATFKEDAKPKIIYIPPGTPFKKVAKILKQEGLIRTQIGFTLEAWRLGVLNKIKAGEYKLDPRNPPKKILRTLAEGKVIIHKVTIPEGYNLWDIAALLEKEDLLSKQEFLTKAFDTKLLKKLGIPGNTAEGYLFPDTYIFYKGISAEKILTKMVHQFFKVWSEFAPRAKQLGLSMHQVVTLASIVEKEAKIPEERYLIAGVFWNRLKRGMPLQADPTVRYVLKKFNSVLSHKDLQVKSPYNTYIHSGLPPGPICNPGKEAIRAVLYPKKTDYLYFVAKGDGSHYFSHTLKEHIQAIKRYRH